MKLKQSLILMFSFLILIGLFSVSMGGPAAAAAPVGIVADFEGGEPGGWFAYNGGGATVSTAFPTVTDTDPLARPGQSGDNTFVEATFDATSGFAGFGQDFAQNGGAQDWSHYAAVSFWLYGSNSGQSFQFEIMDNRSDPNSDTAERFDRIFVDDFNGWQKVRIPFSDFSRATDYQPGGAPDDGLTLTEMWGIAVILDGSAGTLRLDDVRLERAIIDDFESGLPSGTDGDGNAIGFFTFNDPNSTVDIGTTDTPPAPVPGADSGNNVLAMTGTVVSFAGFVHAFENPALDTWVPQDWSSFEGLGLWLYGQNTGKGLFVDVLDNRNPGSTTDDAERFSVNFVDDFMGWQFLEFPFSDFMRKEIGNGAPNDGLTLTQVHGWALGMGNTGGEVTYYVDDATLYGVAQIPDLAVTFGATNYDIDEGSAGDITVKLNRPMNSDDPAQVSVDYYTEPGLAIPGRDYEEPAPGTLTFVNGGPSELSFSLQTLEDSKWEGTERVILRLTNPVDVAAGFAMQAAANIIDNDPYDPNLLDDFERFPYLWESSDNVTLSNPTLTGGDALARPGQDAFEGVLQVDGPIGVDIDIQGNLCTKGNGVIPVHLLTTDNFDAMTVDHTTVTLGNAYETHGKRHEEDVDKDGDMDLVFHFRARETGIDCKADFIPFNGETFDGRLITVGGTNSIFFRDFAIGNDWSRTESLSFWYYGTNTGEDVTVHLKDNRAPDPGPNGWDLVWSDEFNGPAGTPPNPEYWGYEIGDGVVNGIPGWGNDEFQYYTDDPANAATDGQGNMVLTVREADGSQLCYYGACDYTSARLITKHRAEFAYGRIESRILVPDGEAGLWPAFWSLGTDIDVVNWPQTGEIDFMEYVSRLPNEIFGTIHGPGYAGGQSFGNVYDFGEPVYNNYHTFAIEWQPDLIKWYVDGTLYHTATPADVAPNEWVFNDPVYFLLNVAIGGNFGGTISPDLQLPQSMAVDYVRVYQGPDTAERFEATFADTFSGWELVHIPFPAFERSAEQPAGAPNDGLTLSEVWGYGFTLPDGGLPTGTTWLDFIMVNPVPPPTEITVTNLDNSGSGSLRQALEDIAVGGTITFDPALAGQTINLAGPLVPPRSVIIDAGDAPGIALDGGGLHRVLIVDAGITVEVSHLTITNGYGFQLAGGVLNNGTLTLDHVTVTGNTMTTDAGDFWQGGGGIYNGEGATLNLIDSTVSDNTSGWDGGGIYSFFGTTTSIVRSTISNNVALNVGGGLRILGNGEIVNSTISGNTSTAWHGGAMFVTDGNVTIVNSTITENSAPSGTAGGLMVATFGAPVGVTLQNSIVADNGTYNCQVEGSPALAVLTSLGNNVLSDGSCAPIGSDLNVGAASAGIGPLADNGGPTLTHALLAGSPAIDAANTAVCPATDQRGVARDAACDVGAFEYVP